MIDRSLPRTGACPGLFHIVPARDGGLCRLKPARGELSAAQARRIAAAARAHASGIVDITNRANLQLRGVRPGHEDALIQALLDAGLGPLPGAGADAATRDDRRNLMLSPAAGIDAQALVDTRPLAGALLRAMQEQARFDALSPKFAVLLDGGEALAATDRAHDLWLGALPGAPDSLALGLAGAPASAMPAAIIDAAQAVPAVLALIHAFLDLADAGQRRMRELLAEPGAAAVLARARMHGLRMREAASPGRWRRLPTDDEARWGVHRQRDGRCYLGVQPPLGRLEAGMLDALADAAQAHGDGSLRLTPWQGALLPGLAAERAPAAQAELLARGFLAHSAHPLARIVACAGSTGCVRSEVDTKADARRLAAQALPAGRIHLCGCPRSCALAGAADYTLLGAAPARYDLYHRDAGPGLGQRIGERLTLEQAAAALGAAARSTFDA